MSKKRASKTNVMNGDNSERSTATAGETKDSQTSDDAADQRSCQPTVNAGSDVEEETESVVKQSTKKKRKWSEGDLEKKNRKQKRVDKLECREDAGTESAKPVKKGAKSSKSRNFRESRVRSGATAMEGGSEASDSLTEDESETTDEDSDDSKDASKIIAAKLETAVEGDPFELGSNREIRDVAQLSLAGPTVNVLVGSKPCRKYSIHEGLLSYHSNYFRAAFRGNFAEAQRKTIHLRNDNPRIFELFLMWIYYGKMSHREIDLHFMKQEFDTICALYVMGDKHQITDLKNATINAFYAHQLRTETIPDIAVVRTVWKNTYEKDTLRSMCVELFALRAKIEHFDAVNIKLLPKEFVSRVMQRAFKARHQGGKRKAEWAGIRTCDYHDHPNGKRCEDNVEHDNVPRVTSGGELIEK
ncbi:MAG: hypothetical protein M1831_005184 [Alyxoria varia]|nr:MAG: hypothetical protein M1831_005184 [Alyxoria varia]